MKRGSFRSLVDTIIACKMHHNAPIEEVIRLYQEAYDRKTLIGHYCSTINRLVLHLEKLNSYGLFLRHSSYKTSSALIDINLPDVLAEHIFNLKEGE